MATQAQIDKNLGKILETLRYLHMVIKNLMDRHETFVLDVEGVDERLFHEIARYEILTENMKKTFLDMLIADVEDIQKKAVANPDFYEKAYDMINRIEALLDDLDKHEDIDIKKSKSLKKLAREAREKIEIIKGRTESICKEKIKKKQGLAERESGNLNDLWIIKLLLPVTAIRKSCPS
jgi:hypothetical protein